MPKISLIIPVYKVEEFLPACLDSVLGQTFTDWEAICVDDGSPDNCGKILAKYAKKDKRIKVITQKNRGVSAARNKALRQARGNYICFLDSDDELAPTFLKNMYQLIIPDNIGIVSCASQQGKHKGNWGKTSSQVQTYKNPFKTYMEGSLKMDASIWGKLYKKEVLKGLQFSKETGIGEDLVFLYKALYQTSQVIHTPEQLYFYRIRENSAVNSGLSERVIFGNIKTAELLSDYFKNKKLSSKTRKILNQKIAKRIFKFAVLEPKRKDRNNLNKWYGLTRPLLFRLKQTEVYQPKHLTLKNQLKSWIFLKGKK